MSGMRSADTTADRMSVVVPADRMARLLESGDRRLLSHKAAAQGLTLCRVFYEPKAARRATIET